MMIYSGEDMEKVQRLQREAIGLSSVASRICGLVRDGVQYGPAKVFEVYHVENGTDVVLDFRLNTNLGQVYCRFDLATDGHHLLGKYNFFLQTSDDENIDRQVRVFSVLFDGNGRYVFGDRWTMDMSNDDAIGIGADFVYYLIGNVLGNIHDHLPKYTTTAQDIKNV